MEISAKMTSIGKTNDGGVNYSNQTTLEYKVFANEEMDDCVCVQLGEEFSDNRMTFTREDIEDLLSHMNYVEKVK